MHCFHLHNCFPVSKLLLLQKYIGFNSPHNAIWWAKLKCNAYAMVFQPGSWLLLWTQSTRWHISSESSFWIHIIHLLLWLHQPKQLRFILDKIHHLPFKLNKKKQVLATSILSEPLNHQGNSASVSNLSEVAFKHTYFVVWKWALSNIKEKKDSCNIDEWLLLAESCRWEVVYGDASDNW